MPCAAACAAAIACAADIPGGPSPPEYIVCAGAIEPIIPLPLTIIADGIIAPIPSSFGPVMPTICAFPPPIDAEI
ncbi:hypothetical protein IWW43_006585 [Coemansia sp. RSA 1935]|nr:hypothetical protein IWW43_006585 [Coemansia sp. RSA 1935]